MSRISLAFTGVLGMAIVASATWGATYTDDFARPDGDSGHLVAIPAVEILSEELHLQRAAGEPHVWIAYLGEPIYFDNVRSVSFKIRFGTGIEPGIGAHGGVILCSGKTMRRWDGPNYAVDWIERDKTYRLYKTVGTTQNFWPTVAAPAVAGIWRIEFDDEGFRFYAGDAEPLDLIAEIQDAEHRSGYIGFWCYQNAGQEMFIDDLAIESEPACPLLTPAELNPARGGTAELAVRLPYGLNDAAAKTIELAVDDTGVADLEGGTAGKLSLIFNPGETLTQRVNVLGTGPGRTRIRAMEGGCEALGAWVNVLGGPFTYFEDFAQTDGPPEGWQVTQGNVTVASEELVIRPSPEPHAWAGIGGTAIAFPKIDKVKFRIKYAVLTDAIKAHGGVILCAQNIGVRSAGTTLAYVVDILERDGVLRIYKNGNQNFKTFPVPPNDGEFHDVEIEFVDTGFTVSLDGMPVGSYEDTSYRGGRIGFWCYTNAGQTVTVDDLEVTFQAGSCPSISPASVVGRPVDAPPIFTVSIPYGPNLSEDYVATVTTTDDSVVAPEGHTGGSLEIVFERGGPLSKTFKGILGSPGAADLVVTAASAGCPGVQSSVAVPEPGLDCFEEDFARPDGPPDDWTIRNGAWTVASERLTMPGATNAEAWIWAGNPATRMEVTSYSFTLELTRTLPDDGVGRHGGVMFCGAAPSGRYATSGYTIDWLDRPSDGGYRMIRSDNGAHTLLGPGTLGAFPLGTEWRIEFDGERILFYSDGDLVFDVVDATYRQGYLGFWTYSNASAIAVDDLKVGECEKPPIFLRGDTDGNGSYTLGDGIQILERLFAGRTAFDSNCEATGDLDDSGDFTIGDAIWVFNFLFANGAEPAPPYPGCGPDPTPDALGCLGYPIANCPK